MGNTRSRTQSGYFHADWSGFDYYPAGAWTATNSSTNPGTIGSIASNATQSNASIAFDLPSGAVGWCLYRLVQENPPSMIVIRNGATLPVDPNFQIASLNDSTLTNLFSTSEAQNVQPFFCQTRQSISGFYDISLNQTSPGSIQFSGLAAYRNETYQRFSTGQLWGIGIASFVGFLILFLSAMAWRKQPCFCCYWCCPKATAQRVPRSVKREQHPEEGGSTVTLPGTVTVMPELSTVPRSEVGPDRMYRPFQSVAPRAETDSIVEPAPPYSIARTASTK